MSIHHKIAIIGTSALSFLTKLAFCMLLAFPALATVEESLIPDMEHAYLQNYEGKVNSRQKERIQYVKAHQAEKFRVMTYNMLFNIKSAEDKLPPKHRWENRKPRLLEYLVYAQADIIGAQELQQDQLQELMQSLGKEYSYYGEKTKENEGRSDTNAIIYNKKRFELLNAKTIPYLNDSNRQNAFTYGYFKDKLLNKNLVVINTKLTWGDVETRFAEATQLSHFARDLPSTDPIIVTGDFNTFPFMLHNNNIFFDGDDVSQVMTEFNLKDAISQSAFGHFGPICSINNAKDTIEPFVGPELTGFILDHIFINKKINILAHTIDTAKVNNEYPSDHLPVIVDMVVRDTVEE